MHDDVGREGEMDDKMGREGSACILLLSVKVKCRAERNVAHTSETFFCFSTYEREREKDDYA